MPFKIDRAALAESKTVLLAAANTPEAYTQLEWFPADRAPTQASPL